VLQVQKPKKYLDEGTALNYVRDLTKEQALELVRKIMGPPKRELEGEEREQVLTMLALKDADQAFNNQRFWTDVYFVGNIKYHVTSGTGLEPNPIVEEYLNE
jgi:hypothetical protein